MSKQPRTQMVTLDTIRGPEKIPAPAGWKFDATAIIVWNRLCWVVRDKRALKKKRKPRNHEFKTLDDQGYMLAMVLASALGMAPPYWQNEAEAYA